MPVTKVSFNLPFGIGGVEWEPDKAEAEAAWALYIELVTRVSTQPLAQETSVAREALDSLHSLFDTTRDVLRAAGPNVGVARDTLGGIAIAVLNDGLRPFLSRWHGSYSRWSGRGDANLSDFNWPDRHAFYDDLGRLQEELGAYAKALYEIATVDQA